MTTTDHTGLEWLFTNAGPIVRWRLVRDFDFPVGKKEARKLLRAVVATEEVQRWLDNLGVGGIHGSKDTDAENAIAKLVEYGLQAGIHEFDEKMLPYADRVGTYRPIWLSDQLIPFLIAGGYAQHENVRECFLKRLAVLYEVAKRGDFDIYLSPEEAAAVPKAWQGKPIYRLEYHAEGSVPLPSCYDLYAIAHWPHDSRTRKQAETVLSFISHPEFQNTQGGYLWDRKLNRCYAAGREWLACCEPQRTVLFIELTARFALARQSEWFGAALADLETHRAEGGRYVLPREYLKEKRNSYYIYQVGNWGRC